MTLSDNSIKILASVILFSVTLLVGTIPVYIFECIARRLKKKGAPSITSINSKPSTISSWWSHLTQETVVQFLTQVGGGVLLYTALIHMLPEIRDNYRSYQVLNNVTSNESCDSNPHSTLPLVDIITCAGFFGMFFIEEIMHAMLLKNHHHHYEKPGESISLEIEQNQTRKYYLICIYLQFFSLNH